MFQMNFIFFSLVSAFSFTQTRFSSNWKLKIKKISSVSDAIFWRRFVLEDLCSNLQILLHFSAPIKIVAMSSVYSMHRPGFWRVPKFKTKEPQPTQKKKVHFYDEFVSVFFFEEIIFFLNLLHVKWKVTGWQASTLTAPLFIQKTSIHFKVDDFCFEKISTVGEISFNCALIRFKDKFNVLTRSRWIFSNSNAQLATMRTNQSDRG